LVPSQLVKSDRDPRSAVGQEGRQAVFRLQGSCRVDKGSAIIRRVKLTGASVNDTVPADELICGDEAAVYADAAYHTHRREQQLIERGIEAHLMRRANKHHALSEADKERNEAIGQQRAAVEQVFGRMKTTYRWARARCLGLARNTTHLLLLCTAMNLKRMVVLCARRDRSPQARCARAQPKPRDAAARPGPQLKRAARPNPRNLQNPRTAGEGGPSLEGLGG
jgi:hypothetical protein